MGTSCVRPDMEEARIEIHSASVGLDGEQGDGLVNSWQGFEKVCLTLASSSRCRKALLEGVNGLGEDACAREQ